MARWWEYKQRNKFTAIVTSGRRIFHGSSCRLCEHYEECLPFKYPAPYQDYCANPFRAFKRNIPDSVKTGGPA